MILAQGLGDEDRQAPGDEEDDRSAGASVGRDCLQFSFGLLVVEKRRAGGAEHGRKLRPRIGSAHIDDTDAPNPRPRLALQHWEEWLPAKVKELKADGRLDEELGAAASLAQTEIEHLMKQGYPDWAAREVALPLFILLSPEVDADGLDKEQREELAEKEREYRRNPPVYLDEGDPNE
jgi:hypothetical protein